jgi:AmiR/NasT family two-component response regulator
MEQQAPRRAQLERDVALVVGTNHAHQAKVWQAIGMLRQTYDLDERAALASLRKRATARDLSPVQLAARMVSRQEPP